jgi:hypothetical protein
MADVGNTFAVVVVVILTLTTGHVCFADLEVPDPISQVSRHNRGQFFSTQFARDEPRLPGMNFDPY